MRRIFTRKLIVLLGVGASVAACQRDPLDRVESAQEKAQENAAEVQDEHAELMRKQAAEQAKLAREQGVENAQRAPADREQGLGERVENKNAVVHEQNSERAELGREQAKERADLQAEAESTRQKDLGRLAKAAEKANEDKLAFAKRSRERLRELEERASKLNSKRVEAEPGEQAAVSEALVSVPTKCKEAEQDISALEGATTTAEWTRAKSEVQNSLASIERSLDRADRLL